MPSRVRPRRPAESLLAVILWAASAACAASGGGPPAVPAGAGAAGQVVVSVVGTSDVHGGLIEQEGRGGAALFSGYLRNLRAVRAADGGAVLLLDAGDMFQGTLESNLSEGASVVDIYNALGYTAAAVGNHEFDFGPAGPAATPARASDDPRGALKRRATEARFPFLAANLIDERTGLPVDWPNVRPTTMVEVAGLRVGVIGVLTREALSATLAANVGGLRVAPLARTIAGHADALRAAGADAVVVAAHAGGRCKSFEEPDRLDSCDPSAEIFEVARDLPAGAVDAIVAGHSHAGVAHRVAGIPIVQSYSGGRAFGRIDLVFDRRSERLLRSRIHAPRDLCRAEDPATGRCVPADSPGAVPASYEGAVVVPDPAVIARLAPVLESVRAAKEQPIGAVLDRPIRRSGAPESPLGNLFTDALLSAVPGADAALHNVSGGLRADLPAGPLTYGRVYEVMPFDNRLVVLHLTGRELETVFARHLQRTPRLIGVAGLTVRAWCDGGVLQIALTRPSGGIVHDDERLTIVASDFLASGGDGILAPVAPPEGFPVVAGEAPLARDALVGYLRRLGSGIDEARLVDPARPRLSYEGTAPLSCAAAAP